jgi:iron complex transport system substrate-binding protein
MAPATRPAGATVASLVPAATDLIIAMGRSDRLVAVSNYDSPRGVDKPLPKVGDYQNTDWEQIRTIRPTVMIRQFAPDRVPPGLTERCGELGIRLVNLRFGRLEDVFTSLDTIGQAIDVPADAAALKAKVQAQLDAVRLRAIGQPKPRVLLVLDEAAENVIGPGEFLDDLLKIAGAVNAAGGMKNPYPSIDREMLRSLDPDVIIQLLPEATPQKLSQAKQTWAGLGELKAVRSGRIDQLTDWYVLQPGAHVGDIAEQLSHCIHPAPTTRAASTPKG